MFSIYKNQKGISIGIAFAALMYVGYTFAQSPGTSPAQDAPTQAELATPADPAAVQEAGVEKDQPAENAHLAAAGEFQIGKDPTVWVLIVLFNLALAVGIERTYILFRNRGNNAELVRILTERLAKNPATVDDLADDVGKKTYGMEGRVAAVALRGWSSGERAMEEYAASALIAEKRTLDRRLVVLSTLGNNTPFIGLLGTVLGIMRAFRDLAVMGDAGPAVVMKGISEALVATAMGLGVAIPCVIAFNALGKAVKDRMSCAEEIVSLIRAIRLSMPVLHGSNGSGSVRAEALAGK